MLTIVFYSTNGQVAKYRAREIAAAAKGDYSRCYDVSVWDGTADKCDVAEIMPDVPDWQRSKIKEVFGEKAVDYEEVVEQQIEGLQSHLKPLGLMPEKPKQEAVEGEGGGEVIGEKKAVHRGGGRWFVTQNDQVISGPHDKAEAKRLCEA